MLHREGGSACRAPMVALLRRGSLRCCVVILSIAMFSCPKDIDATTYVVSPDGDGDYYTLANAMDLALPGDVVQLEDGTYREMLETVRNGEDGSPITVTGGGGATIKTDAARSVEVRHSFIHLVGFSVNGYHGSDYTRDSWVDKCVWVDGGEDGRNTPIEGFVMRDMTVRNCGSECVRLKNFVTGAIVINNLIENCGVYDYELGEGEKNGEGIYIGTADNQWEYGMDVCDLNYVSGNNFETNGNECVEVKEGSTRNVIERNICSNQLDTESGCFSARGDANTIRFNVASFCSGAGIRLGGDVVDGYTFGQFNNVYGNEVLFAEAGSIKVQVDDQGLICGNICEDGACEVEGNFAEFFELPFFAECQAASLNAQLEDVPTVDIDSTPSPSAESSTGEYSPSPTASNDDDNITDDDNRPSTPTPSLSAEPVTGEPSPSPIIVDDYDSFVNTKRPITTAPSPVDLGAGETKTAPPTISNGGDDDDDDDDDDGDDDNDDGDDGDDYGVDGGDDGDDGDDYGVDGGDDGDDDDDSYDDDGDDYGVDGGDDRDDDGDDYQ